MLAIRSIIVVFVNLFRWKTSKKFLLTLEREKNLDFRQFFYLKMLISRNSIAHDFNACVIIDSETESFTEEPMMKISRNVATIRRTSFIRFK